LKRFLGIFLLCAVAGALVWFLVLPGRPTTQDETAATGSAGVKSQPSLAPASPATSTSADTAAAASLVPGTTTSAFPPKPVPPAIPFLLGSAETPPPMEPGIVLNNMRIAINQYASRFSENPVGTNLEITKALNGGNPKEAKFISADSGLRINALGELVDYWGTPFFFHQLSGTEMEIRSAGPDRVMWTADDLVTR
jgi:hypothetical protein